MIRLMLIIPTLDQGGAEKQLVLLATRLPREEFDVHVCLLTRGGPLSVPLQQAQIPVIEIQKRYKIDPFAYGRLRRQIKHLKPDIVHTWLFSANAYGRQAAFSARVPTVIAGERCVDRWKVGYELAIDRQLARRTHRIVANSSGIVDFYAQHGIDRRKFTVIPNGIAVPDSSPTRSKGRLLTELGLPPEARLIGAVGRLWPQKRYKDLIWAAELLRAVRDDTHLLVIGEGPDRRLLMRYRDQVELTDRVHFLGHRSDVPDILPQLDCFWLGSGYEGLSNAVMEAMAAEVPVVATDIPGNRDLVVPNETGYLVPVGDRAAFARQTQLILDDQQLASRLGQAARLRMRECFSIERMVQQHVELYRGA